MMDVEKEEEIKSQGTQALIAGIVSLVLSLFSVMACLILAPFGLGAGLYATYAGIKVRKLAAEEGVNESNGQVGMILGIIGSILGAMASLLLLVMLIFVVFYIVMIFGMLLFMSV